MKISQHQLFAVPKRIEALRILQDWELGDDLPDDLLLALAKLWSVTPSRSRNAVVERKR